MEEDNEEYYSDHENEGYNYNTVDQVQEDKLQGEYSIDPKHLDDYSDENDEE